jgi:CheY-like chemotaxis protein
MARVLIVEDVRDTADSLQVMLELEGHEVAVVYSGTEGVQLAGVFRPEAVICDIGLPDLDGWAVARSLRQNPINADVLLIALTGYGSEADRARSRASGYDFHFTKPADPSVLMTLLAEPAKSRPAQSQA